MQTPIAVAPRPGRVAWRLGALFGVGLGVLVFLIDLIPVSFTFWIGLLLSLIAYFVVGMLAAKQTGRVGTGSIAGLWAGLISGLIGFLATILVPLVINRAAFDDALNRAANASTNSQHLSVATLQTAAIAGVIILGVLVLLLSLGLGAGVGALGGLLGKNQAQVPAAPIYQEQLYQSPGQQPPPPPVQP